MKGVLGKAEVAALTQVGNWGNLPCGGVKYTLRVARHTPLLNVKAGEASVGQVADSIEADYRPLMPTSGVASEAIFANNPPPQPAVPAPQTAWMNVLDIVGRDTRLLRLVDHPRIFPKIWGIMGWNIALYHSHYTVTPPEFAADASAATRLSWHQDSGQLNVDLEQRPQPRISMKVGFYLTDSLDTSGRDGNMALIPGSHRWPSSGLHLPADGVSNPAGVVHVAAAAGDCVLFDRCAQPLLIVAGT